MYARHVTINEYNCFHVGTIGTTELGAQSVIFSVDALIFGVDTPLIYYFVLMVP